MKKKHILVGLCTLLAFSNASFAQNIPKQGGAFSMFKKDEAISSLKHGKVEVIFINLWDEYYTPTTLPPKQADVTRVFLQPDINVDNNVLNGFVEAYPQFSGLQIDKNQKLALSLGVWQTPSQVIMNDGQVQQINFLGKQSSPDTVVSHDNILLDDKPDTDITLKDTNGKAHHFGPSSNSQVLFFSDALCPFQHLPKCEQKINANNQLVDLSEIPVKTIIKPFYITAQDVTSYQQRFELNHPVILDAHNQLFQKYEITSLPYWIVLNSDDKVIYRGEKPPKRL
ncbi:TlpA family protein disulfide reductase [Pseudoalteromonas sp. S16_S37]|uniref:TlpA family protein disulfide reductase n=1 Tax=Pseudoalteromonas sp. S16_S37 TaxID=2720228 RepID=UPI00168115D6|nr:hypothetical protein [Pseudoalteromonas sp. S16_S37]MBD1581865.1 hypothetical protein [Pseudoalteromonas sp. S16_S37]